MRIRLDGTWRLARKAERTHIRCKLRSLEYSCNRQLIDTRTWESPYDYTIGLVEPVRFTLGLLPSKEAIDYLLARSKDSTFLYFGPAGKQATRVRLVELRKPKRGLLYAELMVDDPREIMQQWAT